MTWTEQIVELKNGPLRLQWRGDGPLFFWTHGVFHPIDVDDHTPIPRVLSELTGWKVVRYDTRGHGRTPPAATDDVHRWDRLADELLELAQQLGAERFVAGGISMGAAVSLHAAVKFPERVAGLALLAPPTGWETRPPQLDGYRALAALGAPEAIAAHIQGDLEREHGAFGIGESLRAMVEGIRTGDGVALGRVLRAAAQSDLPAKAAVARIAAPAAVMPWENDPGHPIETARELARLLPAANLRVVGGVDDPQGILAAMQEVLEPLRRTLA